MIIYMLIILVKVYLLLNVGLSEYIKFLEKNIIYCQSKSYMEKRESEEGKVSPKNNKYTLNHLANDQDES